MKAILLVGILFCVAEVYSYQSSFIRNCLDAHNTVRALHGVSPLSWSSEIAVKAQKWANHLAAIDQLQHDSTTSDGENLFYMYGGDPEQACDRAVKNWYQEFKNYDFKSPHLEDSTNHFSQLVWRNSQELGIGTAQSKSGNFFLVARYSPPGNIDGQFNDNVPDALKEKADEKTDESSQESKDSSQQSANSTPGEEESSSSQGGNDPNVIYFKQINVDSNASDHEMDDNAQSQPYPPRQTEGHSEPNSNVGLESGLEPDSVYSNSRPETQQSEMKQPSSYAEVNTNKQKPTRFPEELSAAPEETNDRPSNRENQEINIKLRPVEPDEQKPDSAPVNEGSDRTQSRPFYPESELGDMNARLQPPNRGRSKSAKDATLEKFLQQPMNDGPKPVKLHEAASGLTYVPPVAPKTLPKKKAPVPIKLPPALALITPKRGKDFRVVIRLTNMTYTSEMQVPGSLAFEEVKRNVTSAIINLFDEDDEFEEVQLISLRNESNVIATLGILFKKDSPGHLNRLTMALMKGKLGNIRVASKYDSAVALPAGYLRPNRLAQPESHGVCAQPCSRPNSCFSSGCRASCCAFHPRPHPAAVLPSCPGTCDDSCFPECDDECCSDFLQTPYTTGALVPTPAPPSITCPGACHFSCYPQCTPRCCSSSYVPNPCHPSCPAYCAPSCDNACCTTRKSLVNSLSKQYSRYRSAQRAVARQLYLKKRLKLQPLSRFHSTTLARPVRPKQRSFYPRRARVRPENLGQDEYDHSINEWAKKGEVVKQSGHQSKYGSGGRFSSWDSQKNS